MYIIKSSLLHFRFNAQMVANRFDCSIVSLGIGCDGHCYGAKDKVTEIRIYVYNKAERLLTCFQVFTIG